MKIPARFNRFAAAFGEASRVRSCESSGSEHSADLSDLVNSFLEREGKEQRSEETVDEIDRGDESESNSPDFESRVSLEKLFSDKNDAVRKSICEEVEAAYAETDADGGYSTLLPDLKRRLMSRLRSKGFDSGLCKSKWEKNGQCPPGEYEYVDVNARGKRYIVEVFLAGKFTIARPSKGYAALLEVFPKIYVGEADDMKKVVRLMCKAIRRSMKGGGIHVPPWRHLTYMQSKWFGSYKRTTNEIAGGKTAVAGGGGKMMVGFLPIWEFPVQCGREFTAGCGFRAGNLAALLNNKEMVLE